jgi:NDP-sugar pyrophosphorylase family protein
LPKPLVPLFHRPLAEWAMLACAGAGIERFAVNTHHLPDAWAEFGAAGLDVTLFHEPVLLETGGGLKNIAQWLAGEPVLVHNADIFSTMPLEKLLAAHAASGLPVTLALRSHGEALHIAVDETGSHCTDIRNRLGRAEGTHVFSGVYCAGPELLAMLPAGEKVSVIPAFLELARQGRLGTVVLDEGEWVDWGDRAAYLRAHRELALGPAIHPAAVIEAGAQVADSVIGPGAVVRAGAVIRSSVVWPGCEVLGDAVLDECIVFSGKPAAGVQRGADL